MNTKWQKELIKSLALSPYLFEDFVMKQDNKQMLWQFVKRIWPYRKLGPNNYDWMNVGIEIEHIASNSTEFSVCNRILQLNCVSYDSGYDNHYKGRANENRIRLNGIRGLKGLYYLLSDMQKNNCIITSNCGLHYHIDATHMYRTKWHNNNSLYYYWDKIRILFSRMDEKICTPEEIKSLSIIFRIPAYKVLRYLCKLRLANYFYTIEHRYLYPSLCYSEYVIQLLACIHITDRVCKELELNEDYLLLLSDIIKEIRNKNYSI